MTGSAFRSGRTGGRRVVRATTLVELMVVAAILSLTILAMYELLSTTLSLSSHSEGYANILQWSQQGINRISEEVSSLRRIYANDALGAAYLAALPPPSGFPRLNPARLPTVAVNGNFRTDTPGNEQTGNCFLICKERSPFDAALSTGPTRRIDVYSLVLFHLSPVDRAMGPWPRSLVLARWESLEYADWTQVTSLAPAERTEVVQLLWSQRAITHLWRPDQDPAAAFYPIDDLGTVYPIDPAYAPAEARDTNLIPNLGFGFAGVAWNRDNQAWTREPVPLMGLPGAVGDGFPHGFETQVIGPTGARTIHLRLVVAIRVAASQELESFAVTSILNAHEF